MISLLIYITIILPAQICIFMIKVMILAVQWSFIIMGKALAITFRFMLYVLGVMASLLVSAIRSLIEVIVHIIAPSKNNQKSPRIIDNIDQISQDPREAGIEYEYYCSRRLKEEGYKHIEVTPASNDFGADIVAFDEHGRKWVFQCKYYNSSLGNSPIQEVVAAKKHYGAEYAGVITNAYFTQNAKELAKDNGVLLQEGFV